ncbi:BQ5605_C024g09910 [Microbotryum silenes-dioicae]|uniref:Serine/threonine-protein kinase Tel1 n=1 Tax=Microbotryum silenes-dioicae TaxID=796604 RepID=A0A2X0PM95_9BASI|nr:BQ5605_C024g09910 [Microbotryum silenes-dioicae]
MSTREWNNILTLIESDKIKDRVEGVSLVRGYLGSRTNFNALDAHPNHSWTDSLQRLFGLVIKERNVVVVKPTSIGEKRLEDAAMLVAWFADKVSTKLPKKGVKSLLEHLTQMIASVPQGQQQSFMLAYSKALKLLLGNQAHVEHLGKDKWAEVVMICFSVVLGDKVRPGQKLTDEAAIGATGDGFDDDGEESDDHLLGSSHVRHRRRGIGGGRMVVDVNDYDDDDDTGSSVPTSTRKAATALEIELVGCIETLFRSRSAPFLLYAQVIFVKFARLFRQYPHETTAHESALIALNRAFAELDLNDQLMMGRLGVKLWCPVLSLWATKNNTVKEQVVMALRQLLPFVLRGDRGSHQSRVTALYESVLTEPTIRTRELFRLNVDHLRLAVGDLSLDTSSPARPFKARNIQLGHGFTDKDANAWAVLELGADALAKIFDVDAAGSDQPVATPSRNGKRRRVEEPLSCLIDSLEDVREPSAALAFRAQLAMFFIEKHPGLLNACTHRRMVTALGSLVSHKDSDVRTWAILALAAAAAIDAPIEQMPAHASPVKRKSAAPTLWDSVWSLAIRTLSSADVGRCSAHLCNTLLAYDRVARMLVSTTLESFTKDLDVIGPRFPSDAVCAFLRWCLALSTTDTRLYRLRLPERVLTWLVTAWKPFEGFSRGHTFGQSRLRSDPFSLSALVSLIARLCDIGEFPSLDSEVVIPDCAIASMVIDHCETAVIRDFIGAKVAISTEESTKRRVQIPSDVSASCDGGVVLDVQELRTERRISSWLQKSMAHIQTETEQGSSQFWDSMDFDLARRYLDFATFALNVESLFSLSKSIAPNRAAVRSSTRILEHLAPSLGNAKWRPHERSLLLTALDGLFIPLDEVPSIEYRVLLDPGPASGIASHLTPSRSAESLDIDFTSFDFRFLRHMWSNEMVRVALGEIASVFHILVTGIVSFTEGSSSQATQHSTQALSATQASQRLRGIAQSQREDDFGEVRIAKQAKAILGPSSTSRYGRACMRGCIKGLVSAVMAMTGSAGSVRVNSLIEAIVNAPGEDAITIAEQVLNAVRVGVIDLSLSHAERVLQYLGEELLSNYQFARDERFALLGLKFLECTAPTWVLAEDGDAAEAFGSRARMLCSWYTANLYRQVLSSWRVRLRFLAFLDLYLSLDRTQLQWDHGGYAKRSGDGLVILPTAIIPSLLADEDFRVRFRAATSAPALFTFMRENGLADDPLFADIRSTLEINMAETERVLTQILSQANIMIVAASRRRAPYPLFLQQASEAPKLLPPIVATLAGAAKKMGLGGLRDLYQLYARYNVYMLDKQGRLGNVGSLAYSVAGYPSLREARKADYQQIAGLLLVLPDGAEPFDTLCDVLQKPRGEVVLDCFPQTIALLALRYAVQQIPPDNRNPVGAMDGALALIRALARETGAEDDHQVEKLVLSVSDEIVAQILAEMHEPVWTQDLVDHVLGPVDKNMCATFKQLVGLSDTEIHLVEAPPPHYQFVDIVTTTRWFEKQCHCFTRQASMFLLVHNLLARVHRAPFVDLQRALLISLALALAFGRRAARDPQILDAVINALVDLLTRPELLSAVSKIIGWCLSQWIGNAKSVKSAGSALSAVATRTAHACHRVRSSGTATEEALKGCDILSTLLLRVLEALSEHHAAGANEACLLWPTHLVEVDRMSLEAIGAVLCHSTTTISKFSIAQALADRPDFSTCPERGQILWRLLRSFKPAHVPTTADCAALADLLFQCSGEADAPGLDKIAPADCAEVGLHDEPILNDAGVRSRILSEVMRTTQADGTSSVELAILSIGVARALLSVPSSSELVSAAESSSHAGSLVATLSDSAVTQPHRSRAVDARHLAELDTDMWLHAAHDFEPWIKEFSTLLADIRGINEAFYAQLAPLLSVDAEFAAQILPSLMLSVLIQSIQHGDGKPREQLSVYMKHVLSDRTTDERCVSLVVTVAVFLRRHPRPDLGPLSLARFDRWLEVPWILLAESAARTGQHFNALLLLELAHEYDQLFQRRDTRLDSRGQSLLYDIYSEIDEPDGFYGRQSEDVVVALERRYRHENRWREAFALHGAIYEANAGHGSSVSRGVLDSLSSFGFNRLTLCLWQPQASDGTPASTADPSTTLSYELAWKTDTWDLPVDRKLTSTSQAALFSTLRSVHTGHDDKVVNSTATSSLKREVRKLSCVTLDQPQPKLEAISTILALREVKAASFLQSADRLGPGRAQELACLPSTFSLHNAEKVLSTRISLLRAMRKMEEANSVGDEFRSNLWREVTQAERACLLKLSAVSRTSGHLQASLNAVTVASRLVESKRKTETVDQELAMVLWALGEHSTAISLLESVSNHRPAKVAIIRATLARWTMEARLKSSREILDDLFKPAVNLLDESYLVTEKAQVYHAFANFADRQYQEMLLATKDRRHRFSLFEQSKNHEFEHIDRQLNGGGGSSGPSSAALRNARKTGEQTLSEDKHQLEEDLKATADMHRLALDNYAKSLAGSDEFDDGVLRFCALWLPCDNDVELNRFITPLLKLIPSHKFVFLVHQLSARLVHSTTEVSSFGSNISSLVLRLCVDHPFHCLYAVNTLRDLRASQAPMASGRSRRGSAVSSDQSSFSSRAQAAEDVFDKVRRLPHTRAKADAIATVCDAYREWADFPLRDSSTYWVNSATSGGRVKPGHLPISKSCRILTKVVDLPIPVTTFPLAVDPTCRYDPGTFPTIQRYSPTFTTAGGINLPKIVKCIGSDGKEFKQLLKGNDDIRQDAVMEQVFALCNNILKRDEATRRRKLLIRTYKVVPLQNATGLIEFVANTELLKTKLEQYYDRLRQKRDPGMITPREGSNELATVRGKAYMRCAAPPEINDQLAAKFREVLPRIPPMMRHVFLEHHKVPSLWFEYRLNYSRSVATTSIIGYIVGLGDRHCSNLLMDKVRGEIVTIDLGIAFDQGKRLPIPETVPFRLTQNIVDGLGMSGVDGVFRRCSEETLRVLRLQSNVLLTVLEVLKHDPLQRWAVSAEVAKHIQQSDEIDGALLGSLPDDADRALAVVAQKLDDRLSVAYTVNELIQEATDPANLSRIFQGWQPFL